MNGREPVYDVYKCSWCVQGNHKRCHGPCICEHKALVYESLEGDEPVTTKGPDN